jgi:hypothetical protein
LNSLAEAFVAELVTFEAATACLDGDGAGLASMAVAIITSRAVQLRNFIVFGRDTEMFEEGLC